MTPSPNIAREEWDFRPLLLHASPTATQISEQAAATVYEYARESPAIREAVEEYKCLPKITRDRLENGGSLLTLGHNPATRGLSNLEFVPFWNCVLWPNYFLRKPWLSIPSNIRKKRVEQFISTRPKQVYLTINETPELLHYEFPPLRGRARSGTGEHLILWIDWANANNAEIAQSFAKWLKENRPKEIKEPRGDANRANVSNALLTRLGAMRLLNKHSYTDACRIAESSDLSLPDQSEALKIRHRVRSDLRAIFQSENFEITGSPVIVPADEFPLHFKTFTEVARKAKRPKP